MTNSLAALSRSLVYCTEPFRIAFAGKLDVLCFDKTGTLTKDHMILRGVVAAQEIPLFSSSSAANLAANDDLLLDALPGEHRPDADVMVPGSTCDAAAVVMGCCHDLIPRPATSPGDPATALGERSFS